MKNINQQEIATPISTCKRSVTKTVVYCATLVAISIVLKLVSNSLSAFVPQFMKLSFTYLGWYLSAAILGPWLGGAVACLSDVTGQFVLQTGGAPNPILVAGNGLNAMLFGIAFRYLRFNRLPFFWDRVVRACVGALAATVICTLGVNTFGLWIYYYSSMDYFAFTVTRLIQLPAVALNVVLFAALLPVLKSMELIPLNPAAKSDDQTKKAEEKQI